MISIEVFLFFSVLYNFCGEFVGKLFFRRSENFTLVT